MSLGSGQLTAAATALLMLVLSAFALTAAPAGAAVQPFTLTVVEGEGEVFVGSNPDPLVVGSPTTMSGSIDDTTGEISGVEFSTPPITFQRTEGDLIVDITASFDQVGTGEGAADGLGNVNISLDLILDLHLVVNGGALVTDCTSSPISLDLVQVAPRDPVSQQVELADGTFTIPPVANDGICHGAVIDKVNEQLAGPNNSISLLVGGPLAVPPPPGDPSETTLSSTVNTTPLGQPVTFTAQVAPNDATGSVEFFNGPTLLGQMPVEAGGTAAFTTTALPVGVNPVTARYSGDVEYGASTSAPLTHTVTAIPSITADLPPYVVTGGAPSEFTATVTNPDSGGLLPNLRLDLPLRGLPQHR